MPRAVDVVFVPFVFASSGIYARQTSKGWNPNMMAMEEGLGSGLDVLRGALGALDLRGLGSSGVSGLQTLRLCNSRIALFAIRPLGFRRNHKKLRIAAHHQGQETSWRNHQACWVGAWQQRSRPLSAFR
jgi:hypothetical protein